MTGQRISKIALVLSMILAASLCTPVDAKPRHELVGVVVDGNNNGIEGLLVMLAPADQVGGETKPTDRNGVFYFDGFSPGYYRLDVIRGHKLLHRSVEQVPSAGVLHIVVSD